MNNSVIIVSHGQPSDPEPAERDLADLAARVAARLPGWQVQSATLANPGALDRTLDTAGNAPLIYPLFMSHGWFVLSALPKRLGAATTRILPAFGLDPGLPDLVGRYLQETLKARGWRAGETHLLVASHGSGRSPMSKQATQDFIRHLGAITGFAKIHAGFIEEPPYLGDVVFDCPAQTLCLPFFAAFGGHVQDDISDALSAASFQAPCLDPVGVLDDIPTLVAHSIRATASARVEA